MTTITIEEILAEWKIDSVIDESKLNHEIIKTSNLHSKYIGYFMHFKRKFAAADAKMNKMAWQKRKYFRGEMDKSDLIKHGWSQYNGLKPSSTELNQLLDFDSDMNDLKMIVSDYKTAVSCIEYILSQVKDRGYAMKNLVDYQRFMDGG